jgi:hypothetical protein
MSRPSTNTEPELGASNAATISSSVVLPDPRGPYSTGISPGAADSATRQRRARSRRRRRDSA